eukprot:jgi/Bigna1/127101/aug1.3_g1809
MNWVKLGKVDKVKKAIESGTCSVYTTDGFGYTMLMCASRYGHLEIVKFLLSKGANMVNGTDYHGWTALTMAAMQGNVAIVKYIVENTDAEVGVATNSFKD